MVVAATRRILPARLTRAILLVHRYLGVAVGLIMTLWCMSGFVMIYSGYPHLDEAQRLRGLAPLRLDGCCVLSGSQLDDISDNGSFRVEMLAGRPVLEQQLGGIEAWLVDLRTGTMIDGVAPATARGVAADFGSRLPIRGQIRSFDLIDDDQWTVEGADERGAIYRIGFDDPEATRIYIARRTGTVVQMTTRHQRFWGWLGAVPHWLYPTILRQNNRLWEQLVIWSSLAGVFLTATGLYVGIVRVRRVRWSSNRGLFYWHHITGLVFGSLTLAWVGSGLLTMNPWGWLDTSPGMVEQTELAGHVDRSQITRFFAAMPHAALGHPVMLQAAPLANTLFVEARDRKGASRRLDAGGQVAPLRPAQLQAAIEAQLPASASGMQLIDQPDGYDYDAYDSPAFLPAYRVALRDVAGTTLYLDPSTGNIERAVDHTQRISRWTRTALHDWDLAWMRKRPLRDVLILLMLAGVTASTGLGAWLAVRRAARDLQRLIAPSRR